ncbi:MAG: GNAT family N-acetyltransferase, partial [Acidimicrobiia bacterium]
MQVRPVSLPDDVETLEGLFEIIEVADGHHPIGEHKYLDLTEGRVGEAVGLVVEAHGSVVGYAALTPGTTEAPWGLEIAVHPLHRRLDLLRGILAASLDEVRRQGGRAVRAWVFQPTVVE